MSRKLGFSLIEILIVIVIISILTGVITIISRPSDISQRSRDNKRESDLRSIDRLISSMSANDSDFDESKYTASGTLYLSLPDSSSTCGSYISQLPSLPSGWSYRCSATPTDTTGQGWIPIPFSSNPLINLSRLPLDPINKPPYYYTFTANQQGYELTALKERGNEEIVVSTARERLISLNRRQTVPPAQEEPVLWFKVHGSNAIENPLSLIASSDGGYVMIGEISVSDNKDILVIKANSAGNVEWSKRYGTDSEESLSIYEVNEVIASTPDGGYVIAAYTRAAGNYDFLVFKINSMGNLDWSRRIGGSNDDTAYAIMKDSNNNLVVMGQTYSYGSNGDILIFKLDLNGNLISARNIGLSSGNEKPYSIKQAPDGDYVVLGRREFYSGNYYEARAIIFKMSNNLNSIVWARTISYSDYALAPYLEISTDGGYLVALNSGYRPTIILKLNSSGNFSWARRINFITEDVAGVRSRSIKQTQDGGYIVVGEIYGYGMDSLPDAFVMKLNASLSLDWFKGIGGNNSEEAYFMLKLANDNYFLILGRTNSYSSSHDFFLAKVNSSGNINNCSAIRNVSSTIDSVSVTVSSQSLSINTPSLPVNSLSLSVSTSSVSSQTICSAQ